MNERDGNDFGSPNNKNDSVFAFKEVWREIYKGFLHDSLGFLCF